MDETVVRLLDTALIVAMTLAWAVERRRRKAAERTIAILADQVNRYEEYLGRPIGRIISSRLDADGTVEVEAMVDDPHVLDLLNEAAKPGQSFSFRIPTSDFTKDG